MSGSTAARVRAELGVVLADDGAERQAGRHRDSSHALGLEDGRGQRAAGGVAGRPHLAVGGLQEPLGDRPQRPRVGLLEELPHRLVADVGLGDALVHPVLDDVGSGVVPEEVVDGGSQLEGALVAVSTHGVDPARVEDA